MIWIVGVLLLLCWQIVHIFVLSHRQMISEIHIPYRN